VIQKLWCVSNIKTWHEDSLVAIHCKQQHDVYMYDSEEGTYCCEARPSYCMDPAYSAYRLKDEPKALQPPDETIEELELEVGENSPYEIKYVHCSHVDALPEFKRGELPEELPDEFVILWDDDPTEGGKYPDQDTIDSFLADVEGDYPI